MSRSDRSLAVCINEAGQSSCNAEKSGPVNMYFLKENNYLFSNSYRDKLFISLGDILSAAGHNRESTFYLKS